jgi:hypothetical protein
MPRDERAKVAAGETSPRRLGVTTFALLHLFELKLLNFGQALPLLVEQVVDLLMQMPDLGFEIDAIVVQRLQACPSSPVASGSS